MLGEFRSFVLRGNVLELAVGIVMGLAFGAVVDSLVEDVFAPLLAAVVGEPDFAGLTLQVRDSAIRYGLFLNSLFSLLVVAAALFFFVVKPVNVMAERTRRREETSPSTRECPECLSTVPRKASRCAFCTSTLTAA